MLDFSNETIILVEEYKDVYFDLRAHGLRLSVLKTSTNVRVISRILKIFLILTIMEFQFPLYYSLSHVSTLIISAK